jgi:branched-chain amino acid transport system ATP-binding protein
MSATLLAATGIRAGYVPGLPIVHEVSLAVAGGEIVTIIGPNGAGKSTLLKAIAGLIRLDAGHVIFDGEELTGRPTEVILARGIGYVPQLGNVFVSLSVEENLVVGGQRLAKSALKRRLAETFQQFPLLSERRRAAGGALSGGERQLLAIARALMTEPRLIILDEPTASLAPKAVADVFRTLRRLAANGVAVLMVEQNTKAALRISDRGYLLSQGRNRLSGPAPQLLADPAMAAAFLGGPA